MEADLVTTFILSILSELPKASIALLVVVDPFGSIPIFLGLTRDMDSNQRRKTFKTGIMVALLLLLAFALLGQEILRIFGIDLYSFMIAGSILLLILAIKILVYGTWEERSVKPEGTGVIPIAFPLLSGPGAITTTMVFLQTLGVITTVLSVIIVFAIVSIILRFIDFFYRLLGEMGSAVVARVMAIFIAAIAIQFFIEGVRYYFS